MTREAYQIKLAKLRKRWETDSAYRDYVTENGKKYRKTDKGRLSQAARMAKFKYGISTHEYKRRRALKDICPLCNTRPASVLDHNHNTGMVRDFLCITCNRHLAAIEDREFIKNATQYLNDWEAIELCQKGYA